MSVPDAHRPTRPAPSRPSRISSKGQLTVPKPVRDYLGLEAGSSVEFEVTADGDVVLRKRPDTARPLRGLLSAYALDGPAPTVDDLE
ncbi:AbrB/MazE/SpoVT family DNA-binding domain-containing protein, partial [Rubrivirga sp.]|uniref:AbrB/MazE/SpoVT family DNA-binding domain-containing protein n=1 Tax=Rubrivirga sp. TaxID=1885344 RepID=UPI003C7721CD